jgi:hypothetical protein
MFTNKHIIAALIVTPILTIIAYFAVDYMVSEKPKIAEAGASYELLAKPNCRYSSGHCGLKNGDFEVDMTVELLADGYMNLSLTSAFPLDGVKLALVDSPEMAGDPRDMIVDNNERTQWLIMLNQPATDTSRIRMVIASNASLYYGDTDTRFMLYQTSFDKDFRRATD